MTDQAREVAWITSLFREASGTYSLSELRQYHMLLHEKELPKGKGPESRRRTLKQSLEGMYPRLTQEMRARHGRRHRYYT